MPEACDAIKKPVNPELNLEDDSKFQLTLGTANAKVVSAEYAVRGAVLLRALEIEEDLKKNPDSYPFKNVVKCNIGNPQSLEQKPITFTRQVLSLVLNPDLLTDDTIAKAFPKDAKARARNYLDNIQSVGAYSESNGISVVRKEVAEYIQNRDNVFVDPENIFLTSGASEGVEHLMRVILRSSDDAILTPIPQYPLYSALTTALDGHFAPYYMGEETGWELDMNQVRQSLLDTRSQGKTVRAMVVINPGNPTGSVLSVENMRDIVEFCIEEKIVLFADEVYQKNIYTGEKPFVSFRKVAKDMHLLGTDGVLNAPLQLASFHSISKGVVGECGLRGGYVDLLGFSENVMEQIYKLASIKLCSNVPGQIATGLMVNPPSEGEESFAKYEQETNGIHASLQRRAQKLEAALNALPGIRCHPIEGAMYAFPDITLPDKFVKYAQALGQKPDGMYAIEVLENAGVVVVPGSGFGQNENTFHFRTTFLPPETVFDDVLERFSTFHTKFMEQW
eukprot:CAMPEP_0204833086 /NCGR_PEP_ID=MMETSP1346-20131115/15638_1 /ASSEMBLY_ACC=CAM_ASM_000771 /TAXON_ID=215587 /ORGANISM="Aplanochytrium stocchinoi, Strain GSBS06" /LENGTH=505 /DNA_ID=CAMNT_0051965347 /DNA_START=521 /DNA_END=2035 /DNA_ORIENTATION=+